MANDTYIRKIRKFFSLLDDNGNQILSIEDFFGAADRVAGSFGHKPGSTEHTAIRAAYSQLWEDVYAGMDTDGDHALSFEEMIAAHEETILGPADGYEKVRPVAQAFLDIADTDRSGSVDRSEYIKVLGSAFRVADDEAGEAFESLDMESRGKLTYGDVHRAVEGFFCSDAPDVYGGAMFGRI